MKFEYSHFSGKTIRPTPFFHQDGEMVLIVTPWNTNVQEAQKVAGNFIELYKYFFSDTQATFPFEQMHSLSIHENYLRTSLIQLNHTLFSHYNQEELLVGFEFSAFLKTNSEIIITQIGHPQVYFSKKNILLQPVSPLCSLPTLYSSENEKLPPLPQNLLGVFSDIPIWIRSFKYQTDDEFILVNKDFIPASFLTSKQRGLKDMGKFLNQDQESFWMGKIHSL